MSVSTLSFSATLPPFNSTSGYNNNFSNTNLSATGNLSVSAGATANNPIVTGSATVNGINFNEQNATQTGNQLKVTYQSNEVNTGVTSPSTVNLNGGGVNFSPSSATTHGSNVTTTYNTSPNGNFNVPINGNAISNGNSSNGETITLESLALVGNTLTATYQFSDNLPNNSIQAPSETPIQNTATVTAQTPSAVNSSGGATFSSRGFSTIGDVLAAANGITFNGTLTGALQQPPSVGQATAVPNPNATLAATLNPNLNLSPNTSLSVTDFIDTSQNAFPTSAPDNTFSNQDNSNNSNNPYGPANNTPSTYGSQSANTVQNSSSSSNYSSSSTQNTGSQVGIYNAISNANASTIRGAGLDTVA